MNSTKFLKVYDNLNSKFHYLGEIMDELIKKSIPTGIQIYADLFRDDLALLAAEIIEKEKPCPSPINPM